MGGDRGMNLISILDLGADVDHQKGKVRIGLKVNRPPGRYPVPAKRDGGMYEQQENEHDSGPGFGGGVELGAGFRCHVDAY